MNRLHPSGPEDIDWNYEKKRWFFTFALGSTGVLVQSWHALAAARKRHLSVAARRVRHHHELVAAVSRCRCQSRQISRLSLIRIRKLFDTVCITLILRESAVVRSLKRIRGGWLRLGDGSSLHLNLSMRLRRVSRSAAGGRNGDRRLRRGRHLRHHSWKKNWDTEKTSNEKG